MWFSTNSISYAYTLFYNRFSIYIIEINFTESECDEITNVREVDSCNGIKYCNLIKKHCDAKLDL